MGGLLSCSQLFLPILNVQGQIPMHIDNMILHRRSGSPVHFGEILRTELSPRNCCVLEDFTCDMGILQMLY